jgi:superfamily II DNA or RNA helicase
MAIEMCGRQTLVVVPTLDLMNQWYDLLLSTFDAEIGLIGGGFYEIGAITVTTYASAFRHQERIGNQFGLIIFDECHHLPSEGYKYAAEFALAPFRLGFPRRPTAPTATIRCSKNSSANSFTGSKRSNWRANIWLITLSKESKLI